jgi:hypothetical protein
VSHRDDYLLALQVALGKAREVTMMSSVIMVAKATAMPPESFPAMTADSFMGFYNWLDNGDPPDWVQEAIQNAATVSLTVKVAVKYNGASPTWWKNAKRKALEDDPTLPKAAKVLVNWGRGRTTMSRGDWDDLRDWARDIEGEWETEEAFELEET